MFADALVTVASRLQICDANRVFVTHLQRQLPRNFLGQRETPYFTATNTIRLQNRFELVDIGVGIICVLKIQ